MNKTQIIKLVVSVALTLAVGAIAGLFTSKAIPGWYASLNQPSFNPPNWIFGPVWTLLYILLGISFFFIWKQEASKQRSMAIFAFFVQLLLNFVWSFLFFYFNIIGLALVEIILLWISIAYMLFMFYKVKPLATYINIPYMLWVTYASILNAAYFSLN